MTTEPSGPSQPVNVRGTDLVSTDTREEYRQKIARITLDSMVQFVGLLDAEGTVLEINQVALDGVGITLAEVEGRPFWTTFWWQVNDAENFGIRDGIQRAAAGEFVRWDAEIYGRSGGTETIIIDASLMPVRDENGRVVFLAAEGRDITEKKAYEREIARQREELAQLDELKTQFFANISHEFRTPLTLMMGPLEDLLATDGMQAPDAQVNLQTAYRNSLRLQRLVNALLDFSRIQAGRIEASYEPTDLGAVTGEIASMFRAAVERAGLRFVVDCPASTESVYVDRDMWEKVVLNLLSNALKFTFSGEIHVSLQERDGQVELSVSDTGTGIPKDDLPHVFERFHRVRDARSRTFEGSGIGLSLVQELARIHGGNVAVESTYGEGTTFRVRLPLGAEHLPADRIGATRSLASTAIGAAPFVEEALRWLPDDTQPEVADAETVTAAESASASGAATVLVADDNADMREYVTRLLAPRWTVVAVPDGTAALRVALSRPVDLVLTDVMMPGLDGFELLRELRANEKTASLPVILLSARAGEEAHVEGLQAGADDYLTKPFSARELIARVETQLDRKAAEAETRRQRDEAAAARQQLQEVTDSLRESEELFRRMADHAPVMIWLSDPEGRRTFVSQSWYEFTGLRTEAGLGFGWLDAVYEEDREATEAAYRSAFQHQEPFHIEYRLCRNDGEYRWVLNTAVPWRAASGEFRGYIGSVLDISERKQVEQELAAANALKDQFQSLVSHELRTPIATIIGNSLLLLNRGHLLQEEDKKQALTDVVSEGRRLQRIVENLLLLSRFEAAGAVEFEPISLRHVVAAEVDAFSRREPSRRIGLDAQPDLPPVNGQETLITQLMENLLSNAAKYSPAEKPVEVSLAANEAGDAEVRVRDYGIGVDEAALPDLFTPFYRATSAKDYAPGMGLGLAVCMRIVEAHGGRIWAVRKPEGGSEFAFTIPAATEVSAS